MESEFAVVEAYTYMVASKVNGYYYSVTETPSPVGVFLSGDTTSGAALGGKFMLTKGSLGNTMAITASVTSSPVTYRGVQN